MTFHTPYRHILFSTVTAALFASAASCSLYYGQGDGDPSDVALCTDQADSFPMEAFPLDIGPTVQAEVPPPPISGGSLALTPDHTRAVVADPDRDRVYLVDLATESLIATALLSAGDEPGRVVVDAGQRAHVALRSGGAIAVIDVNDGAVLDRREVCNAPRGLALDELTGALYVACHGGELISMDPATGAVISGQRLDVGLRDVVVDAEHIYVSKFRTAEVVVLDRQGQKIDTMRPPELDTMIFDPMTGEEEPARFEPAVAWRMIPGASGGVVMAHQRGREGGVSIGRGGYGGDPCSGGVVHAAITPMKVGEPVVATQSMGFAVLPVDLALTSGGDEAVLVAAGNTASNFAFVPSVLRVRADEQPDRPHDCNPGQEFDAWQGQPTSVAVTANGTTVVQFREPAQLTIYPSGQPWSPRLVSLSDDSRHDTGHTMFHMNGGGSVSCASCHPEGGDDARVWEFDCIGPRRTQALQFGLLGTEPFHWDGDMDSFSTLMSEVFVGRMGGGSPAPEQTTAMASWLDSLQAPARPQTLDSAAVERGRQIFQDSTVGCQSCHAGPKLLSNASFDVGTGGSFQVPSLINIVDRAPFIHTGCAPTLRDRFTDPDCGGGDKHGVVSHLSEQEIDDLITYLETL